MKYPLVQYIRDRKNHKKGVIVSGICGNEVCVGYSLCNPLDEFDKEKGFTIANSRLESNDKVSVENIPISIEHELTLFVGRVKRYYPDRDYSSFALDLSALDLIDLY